MQNMFQLPSRIIAKLSGQTYFASDKQEMFAGGICLSCNVWASTLCMVLVRSRNLLAHGVPIVGKWTNYAWQANLKYLTNSPGLYAKVGPATSVHFRRFRKNLRRNQENIYLSHTNPPKTQSTITSLLLAISISCKKCDDNLEKEEFVL